MKSDRDNSGVSYVFRVDSGHRTEIALRPCRTVMLRLISKDGSNQEGLMILVCN